MLQMSSGLVQASWTDDTSSLADMIHTVDALYTQHTQPQTMTMQEAVDIMYQNGLTMFATVEQYGPSRPYTREHAAKFGLAFAQAIDRDPYVATTQADAIDCNFVDYDTVQKGLQSYVLESCRANILVGNQSNQTFSPKAQMTYGQVITMLSKLMARRSTASHEVEQKVSQETLQQYIQAAQSTDHRAYPYYHFAYDNDLLIPLRQQSRVLPPAEISSSILDSPLTRGDVALLFAYVIEQKE